MTREPDLEELAAEILSSKKYRQTGLSADTVIDVLRRELALHPHPRDALQAARRKLHNIAAPYLGDPDYALARQRLDAVFAYGDQQDIQAACLWILGQHASSAERLPGLEAFYKSIFAVTGRPSSLLDLACGLNPFAFAWMGLPDNTTYHAYDIHAPRLALIQHFFHLAGVNGQTHLQDILVRPVQERAHIAFFFKEAHRFEQRRRGANTPFWQALPVRWLVVSLPASGLSGRHDLSAGQRSLVQGIAGRYGWPVAELQAGSEMIFCIDKGEVKPDDQTQAG